MPRRVIALGIAGIVLSVSAYLAFGGVIGSEFLPHLDEGSIWARGTLAPSTGPTEGQHVMDQARLIFAGFPEVTQVVSQVGRSDDGTDATGFFNTEYFVDLKPREPVAFAIPWRQGTADRGHGQRGCEDSWRQMGLFATYRRQHGRSGKRRQRRTGGEDLRPRPARPGEKGRGDHERHEDRSWRGRSGPVPGAGPAERQHYGRSRQGRSLWNQRLRRAGRNPDSRRGKSGQPDSDWRDALRSGAAVPGAVPAHS